ncbi:MAG: response regulator [Candidatus Gastranaerophilaceae bacterium]
MLPNTKKILIVDDSKGWLDYHQAVLKELYGAEFAPEVANSARQAYEMVYNNLEHPYDLIISDLQMELDFEPKHAGEWLIEQIKKLREYQNTPIIIISATYNIKSIANRLKVACLPKAIAARDLTSYKLAIDELM